jgi:hypothetical protein
VYLAGVDDAWAEVDAEVLADFGDYRLYLHAKDRFVFEKVILFKKIYIVP